MTLESLLGLAGLGLLLTFAPRSLLFLTTFAGASLDIRGTFQGYVWRLPWTFTALSEDVRDAFWGIGGAF